VSARRDGDAAAKAVPAPVVVYWRPGCPYCARLRWGLRRRRVESTWINVWNDPSASAFVRSLNAGNETVPTVVVGEVAMVAPTSRDVGKELQRQGSVRGAS